MCLDVYPVYLTCLKRMRGPPQRSYFIKSCLHVLAICLLTLSIALGHAHRSENPMAPVARGSFPSSTLSGAAAWMGCDRLATPMSCEDAPSSPRTVHAILPPMINFPPRPAPASVRLIATPTILDAPIPSLLSTDDAQLADFLELDEFYYCAIGGSFPALKLAL
ncbi:hypothetical protein BD310DRAFT_588701 [Dichomitus squalens]|uniref:Uncharacterized protein n=1 Tax=Dichomitus squalens TaxID=114155 RepID=A0A4Q9PRD4_9APHY|nr:hypothetical protein BD310DRAFT_588701 [Dichomitus squalens]